MKINNISEIQTGLVVTRRKASSKDKLVTDYKMLTLKSFDSVGVLDESAFDGFTSNSELETKYLTKKGDVIIRLTTPYTCICIKEGQEGLLIPSNFAVIRVHKNSFLPEYVGMYLNSTMMEKEFQKSSVSATIPLIKTSFLREVDIKELSMEKQFSLVKLTALQQKQEFLLNDLLVENKKLSQAQLNKLIKEDENGN